MRFQSMSFRRLSVSLMLAGFALATVASPASAHTELESSSPAQGSSVAVAPQQIQLTFGEAVTLAPTPITVTGADGTAWVVGPATVAGAVVTAAVQPSGAAGLCKITYKVLADDGDSVTGTVTFTLTTAVAPPTTAPPTTTTVPTTAPTTAAVATQATQADSDGGFPVWAWILIALGVVVIGALVVVRLRSRSE
jgi:methionine-rich copper-binding protein CopC